MVVAAHQHTAMNCWSFSVKSSLDFLKLFLLLNNAIYSRLPRSLDRSSDASIGTREGYDKNTHIQIGCDQERMLFLHCAIG